MRASSKGRFPGVLVGGRGLQMALLGLALFGATYARTAFSALQEAIQASLALSDNQVALLQGPGVAIPTILAAVPMGLAVDRLTRVRLLGWLLAGILLGSFLTAIAKDWWLLAFARGFIGVAAATVAAAAFSLVSDLYAPAQRGRASMFLVGAQMAGNSAVFALAGELLVLFGGHAQAWRWAMMGLCAPLVLCLLGALILREPSRSGKSVEHPSNRQTWAELWQFRRVILPPLVGTVLIETSLGAIFVWAAPALLRVYKLSANRVGAIMAVCLILSGILGPIVGGFLADYCQKTGGPRRTLGFIAIMSLLTIPAGAFAFAPSIGTASFLLGSFIVLVSAILVIGIALFTLIVPNELRGLCVSTLFALETLVAIGLAPVSVSALSHLLGGSEAIGQALAVICAAMGLLAAVIFFAGRRSFMAGGEALNGGSSDIGSSHA